MTIEKPEGYELRYKRAHKDHDAKHWTPEDAVYSASQQIKGVEVTQLCVCWWEKNEQGQELLKICHSTTSLAEHGFLHSQVVHHLHNKGD